MSSEAFLKAYFQVLENHGLDQVSIVLIQQKIEDAFHKYEVEKDLDAEGKKLYYDLIKKV